MRQRALRYIASITLLAIYLPTVTLSSLHVHHDTIDTTDNCLQCAGHFETKHHHEHDCLYCHFLEYEYFGSATEAAATFLPDADCYTAKSIEPVERLRYGVAQLRAPPSAMC